MLFNNFDLKFYHHFLIDPSATELLIKFLYSSMERPKDMPPIDIDELMDNSKIDKKIEYRKRKKYECLKILAMKIVSFWEWDLNLLQTRYFIL